MKISTIKNKAVHPLRFVAAILFWLTSWQLGYIVLDNALLLPSPLSVAERLFALSFELSFWHNIAVSLGRILLGYGLGVLTGILLAVLACLVPFVHTLLRPMMTVIKATPVASFVILAFVWIESYNLSIFISFLMVLPMIYAAVYDGVAQVDPKLLEVAKVYRFSLLKKLKLIYLPAVAPLLITSLTTAIGFAWKSGVAGEVLAVPVIGIGSRLYRSKSALEMTDLFCWTLVIIILSILAEQVLLSLSKRWLKRKER